jgi:hypothetical protein
MLQGTESTYQVADGETVTVEIEAIEGENTASFVVDGTSLPLVSNPPRTYRFKVDKGPGETHFGQVVGSFTSAAPPTSRFQIFVTGNKEPGKGERYTGPEIRKTDNPWRAALDFERPDQG